VGISPFRFQNAGSAASSPRQDAQDIKASNPKGYKRPFEGRAKLAPVIRLRKHIAVDNTRASIEQVVR